MNLTNNLVSYWIRIPFENILISWRLYVTTIIIRRKTHSIEIFFSYLFMNSHTVHEVHLLLTSSVFVKDSEFVSWLPILCQWKMHSTLSLYTIYVSSLEYVNDVWIVSCAPNRKTAVLLITQQLQLAKVHNKYNGWLANKGYIWKASLIKQCFLKH